MAAIIFKVFAVIVLLSHPTSGHNSKQHLICKNVESVFSDADDNSAVSHPRRIPGIPGKRGLPGEKGDRGLPGIQGQPGSPATVDYERIFQVMEEKNRQEMREIESRLEELRRNITELERVKVNCEIYLIGRGCVWMQLGQFINYLEGERICRQKNSVVARIANRNEYDVAMTLLKIHLLRVGRTFGNAWFDETIDISKESGRDSTTPFRVWYKYRTMPSRKVNATQLYIYGTTGATDADGMINKNPKTDTALGVICFSQVGES